MEDLHTEMTVLKPPVQVVVIYTKEEFRKWLKAHAETETRVALLIHKKHTGKGAPTHRELLDEAICHGWIDTTIKRVDDDTFLRHFTRRNEKSKWSENTLRYAQQLLKAGRMTPQGRHFFESGKRKPTHDHGIPKSPEMPSELRDALSRDSKAKMNFLEWPPSTKKMLYRWVLGAKLPPTRKKRVSLIVAAARKGDKNFLKPAA